MIKKTFTYTDFDGNSRTEDHYFNLTKAECMKLQFSKNGGLDKFLEKIIAEQDQTKIFDYMEEFVKMSYGEKSNDGREFVKNEAILQRFISTMAYSDLIAELATNAKAAADFINGVIPQGYNPDKNTVGTPNS
jgi:hypothetical protein